MTKIIMLMQIEAETLMEMRCHAYCCVVLFLDNYPPTFPNGCTDNVEVFASKLGQQTAVNWSSPAVSDNSGKGVTLQSDIPSGSSFLPGVTSVTYTVTDVSGNTRSCRFTVTVTSKLRSNVGYCAVSQNCIRTGQ